MSLDERVLALENDVAKRYREIEENETMLLGLTVKMRESIVRLTEQVETMQHDFTSFKTDITRRFDNMEQRFTSVESKLEQVLQLLTNRS